MPWRRTSDPYKVWLSEIILQQTTIRQGTPYYEKFVKAYPTIENLATASLDEVLKMWEGLGYYSRARNLHEAAKYLHEECGGKFPQDYQGILSLKGVGPYTAAAIASIVFDIPEVVVDGNVLRLISRLFCIEESIDETKVKKHIKTLAQTLLLEEKRPGDFNQALMELGATVCTYKNPSCNVCPLSKKCVALEKQKVTELPLRTKRIKKKKRYFHYFLPRDKSGRYYFCQRTDNDIWKGLFQPFLVEHAQSIDDPSELPPELEPLGAVELKATKKQALTHQYIEARFYELQIKAFKPKAGTNILRSPKAKLQDYAWPRIVHIYLTEMGYL